MITTLYLVSVGPGEPDLIPPRAQHALQASQVIVGYEFYMKWIQSWIEDKSIALFPLTQEKDRANHAIRLARAGQTVSLVSSGDIGIYAMATLVFELMEEEEPFAVEVIPGITAANACAALLGAPLSHDFATLSLSNLLCPWEWIEERARCIAQGDLAVVFYNVQSQARQEGIYRILQIMLQAKLPRTWCGTVRNAFRPEQEVQTYQLKELPERKFDMFTSIVIGNRFTQKRGKYLYTPRGYLGWQDAVETKNPITYLNNAYWVFSGTSDGNALAQRLQQENYSVVVSAATEYGRKTLSQQYPELLQTYGICGVEARKQRLTQTKARAILDATHPFALKISQQLIELAAELQIPYIRFERPFVTNDSSTAIFCDTLDEVVEQAIQLGKRIFLAIGTKFLPSFLKAKLQQEVEWFVRITPDPQRVQQVVRHGIPFDHICAMQGPFSQEFNEALWKQWNIDCVVTKESGDAGGYTEKMQATQRLGIPVIVLRRPRLIYPQTFHSIEEILTYFAQNT